MISRQLIQSILEDFSTAASVQDTEHKIDTTQIQEAARNSHLTWSMAESSMLNSHDIPLAQAMIQRLYKRYGQQFESMGGTWDILGNGSRFTMMSELPLSTEKYTYTLVKHDHNSPWKLYYSAGNGIPTETTIASIPNLTDALQSVNTTFTTWAAEDIFSVLANSHDHHSSVNQLNSSLEQQNSLIALKAVFTQHHHSQPNWTLVSYLEDKLNTLQDEKPIDEEALWQHRVMLSLLKDERSKYAQSYYHPNTHPPVYVHQFHLPTIMALSALAALDPAQVLRPQYQARLNLITDEQERHLAKIKLITETFDQSFLFSGLYDIAREHSDDNPIGRRDKQHHIPSCPGGSLGRSLFRLCPLNALSIMATGNCQEIEAKALQTANKMRCQTVSYEHIPHEIENFIYEQLAKENCDTQTSVYGFLTAFMYDKIYPLSDENKNLTYVNRDDMKLATDTYSYRIFIRKLRSRKSELIHFLATNIPTLHILENTKLQDGAIRIFDVFIEDLSDETLQKKNYSIDIYHHVSDRELIERLRKPGAKILQMSGLEQSVDQDEEIIAYRRQIRELSFTFKALKHLIINEIRRGLLALNTFTLPDQLPEWETVYQKIQMKLAFLSEQLRTEWEPQLTNLSHQLTLTLELKIGSGSNTNLDEYTPTFIKKINEEIEYYFLLEKNELEKVKALATTTKNACLDIMSKIHYTLHQFEALVNRYTESQTRASSAPLSTTLSDINIILGGDLDTQMAWNTPEAWAREWIRIILSLDMPNIQRELERLSTLMHLCMNESQQLDIARSIAKTLMASNLKEKATLRNSIEPYFPSLSIADEITSLLWNQQSGFKQIALFKQQHIQPLPVSQQNTIIKLSTEFLLAKLQDPKETSIQAEQRITALQALTKLFPDGEIAGRIMPDLGYHAVITFDDLVMQGEGILGPESKEAFESAAFPLQIARMNIHTQEVELADEKVFQRSFGQWIHTAIHFIMPHDEGTSVSVLNRNDPALNKIIQFVILTFCRNLELNLLRIKDKEAIIALCELYLMTPTATNNKASDPLFALTPVTAIHDRLYYLLTHLTCLLTTLTPVISLYQTGYLRIMDRATSIAILRDKTLTTNPDKQLLYRSSTSSPTDIVYSSTTRQSLISGTSTDVFLPLASLPNIPNAILEKKLNFGLITPNHLEEYHEHIVPALALVPPQKIVETEQELADAYHKGVNSAIHRYFSFGSSLPAAPAASLKVSESFFVKNAGEDIVSRMYGCMHLPNTESLFQNNSKPLQCHSLRLFQRIARNMNDRDSHFSLLAEDEWSIRGLDNGNIQILYRRKLINSDENTDLHALRLTFNDQVCRARAAIQPYLLQNSQFELIDPHHFTLEGEEVTGQNGQAITVTLLTAPIITLSNTQWVDFYHKVEERHHDLRLD